MENWIAGTLYKIQMRFGAEALPNSTSDKAFSLWKTECVTKGSFSEWSNIMLIKAITPPTAKIILHDAFNLLPTNLPGVPKIKLTNSFPNFEVQLTFDENSVENLSTSIFTLYSKTGEEEEYSLFEQSAPMEKVLNNNVIKHTFVN